MIESVDSTYRPLFSVKFIHSAYQTPKENFFSEGIFITPDEDTMSLFTDYKMGYRYFNDTLICFIQSKPFNRRHQIPKVPASSILQVI